MKARVLKQLLNNTRYSISNNDEYIAVGSPLCHDLISVDKKTFKIKYALDTFREGRKVLNHKSDGELAFIWDKLQELIDSGEITDIINGNDVIENPLTVFTCKDGEVIETTTDEYGWPNVTVSGEMMYDNTYFKTRKEALEDGLKDSQSAIECYKRIITEKESDLQKFKNQLKEYTHRAIKFSDELSVEV